MSRLVLLNVGLLVSVLSLLVAGYSLAQLALAANTTKTTIMSPPQTNKLAAMPGSLESAKSHLAEAMKDLKAGNTQAALIQVREANQTITQFQQGMLNIMNTHRTPSSIMTNGNNS